MDSDGKGQRVERGRIGCLVQSLNLGGDCAKSLLLLAIGIRNPW